MCGFTNNRVTTSGGHGEPQHGYGKEYWFVNGIPTYSQNLEAWAEFFSSVVSGSIEKDNKMIFPGACSIMDVIAHDLLEGYQELHTGSPVKGTMPAIVALRNVHWEMSPLEVGASEEYDGAEYYDYDKTSNLEGYTTSEFEGVNVNGTADDHSGSEFFY